MKNVVALCILGALVIAGCDSITSLEDVSAPAAGEAASVSSASKNGKHTSSTIVVTSNDLAVSIADVQDDPTSWFFYNDENDQIDISLGSFVTGPGTAPAGSGSAQISVTGTQRRNLATYQFSGVALADITTMTYSTYNPSAGNGGGADRAAYLQFNVDFNGTDLWQRRLVFLPRDNGTIQQNTWQAWDAVAGGNALWRYSGTTWPGTAVSGSTPKTWSQIQTEYPGVRVRVTDSWLGMRVGEPYASGYTENIDTFVFGTAAGTTTFDFEPLIGPPTSKDDCKNGGWQQFNNPSFANQGQCIQYVNTGK